MTSFLDSIATFDAATMARLCVLYTRAATTEPIPLAFHGWLLHHLLLYLNANPHPELDIDVTKFVAWVEDRTAIPVH